MIFFTTPKWKPSDIKGHYLTHENNSLIGRRYLQFIVNRGLVCRIFRTPKSKKDRQANEQTHEQAFHWRGKTKSHKYMKCPFFRKRGNTDWNHKNMPFILIRLPDNVKPHRPTCWQECGASATLARSWWECHWIIHIFNKAKNALPCSPAV